MKAFQFRLKRVLRWRETQLQVEEMKLKKLRADRQAVASRLSALQAGRSGAGKFTAGLAGLQGADLGRLQTYLSQSAEQQKALERQLRMKDEAVSKQQRAWISARQKCQLLEELRARALTTWHYEFDRELDELAADSFYSRLNLQS